MKDKKFIILGLIVFLIIVLFPFWYMRGKEFLCALYYLLFRLEEPEEQALPSATLPVAELVAAGRSVR